MFKNESADPKPRASKRKAQPALALADSLQMLRSAIGYVMQSGLDVRATNRDGKLVIVVRGAQLTADRSQFVPAITLADGPVTERSEP